MENTYWLKQTKDNPLFPDLIWSKPENKNQAGKLLIVGGNLHSFSAPSFAYITALQAGAGTIHLILPSSIEKTVSKLLPEALFAPVTPSGSFSKEALTILLENEAWADGVLLAGDFGRNSETSILLESFAEKATRPFVITNDAIDCLLNSRSLICNPNTVIVADFSKLQKIFQRLKFSLAITSTMSFASLVNALHEFSLKYPISLVLPYENHLFVASRGEVSSTKTVDNLPNNAVIAVYASVWALQNPRQLFKALTTALVDI